MYRILPQTNYIMKNHLLIIVLFISSFSFGQTIDKSKDKIPELTLVGSNFSFTKGNINVELLTEIIQQKQQEVAERAFRDLILKKFDKPGAYKSFATYVYIYNLLHTLTTEKNKVVITRQILNNVMEYCLITGFTMEFIKSNQLKNQKSYNGKINISDLQKNILKIDYSKSDASFDLKSNSDESWKAYNVYLDMAYDIFLNDPSKTMQKRGLFRLIEDSPRLKKWFESDNAYFANKYSGKEKIINETLKIQRDSMIISYRKFVNNSFGGKDLIDIFKDLKEVDFKQETLTNSQYLALKKTLRISISYLKNYTDNNVIATMSEYLLDYTLVEFREETVKTDSITQKNGILYVDAEGLISSLHEKFTSPSKNSPIARGGLWFLNPKLFFIIGVSHNGTFNQGNKLVKDSNGNLSDLNNIYFANEKVGVKFTFADRKYTHSFEPGEEFKFHGKSKSWIRPQKDPMIIRHELMLYGSGLLYNIVDIKSKQNFDYTLAGVSYGITFYNGLILNAGISVPTNADNNVDLGKKMMYNLSFDIPIIEYITAARKKR